MNVEAAQASDANRWMTHSPRFETDGLRPQDATSPWSGHRLFAYDLVRWMRPRLVAELGTHYGVSLFAIAQAIKDSGYDTTLIAVDTWQGDPHAGSYDDDVYTYVAGVTESIFLSQSIQLLRKTFDEALADVEEGSLDILHIDGFHTYEAVQKDFHTWKSRLAPNGIVLLHDVSRTTGYGSAEYWEERFGESGYSFSFDHSNGLGVVCPSGTLGREFLFDESFGTTRKYYGFRASSELLSIQVSDHIGMVTARDDSIASQARLIVERDHAVLLQTKMIDDRDAALRDQAEMINGRDEAIGAQVRMIDDRDDALNAQVTRIEEQQAELRLATGLMADRDHLIAAQSRLLALRDRELGRLSEERLAALGEPPAMGPLPDSSEPGQKVWTARRLRSGVERFATGSHAERRRILLRVLPSDVKAALRRVRPAPSGQGISDDGGPLFDRWFYHHHYEDARSSRDSLWAHYCINGRRQPGPVFEPLHYEMAGEPVDPHIPLLQHYAETGLQEGRTVSLAHAKGLRARSRPLSLASRRSQTWSFELVAPDRLPRDVTISDIAATGAQLVTFDFWDTLVARERPADSGKLVTARRLLAEGLVLGMTAFEAMAERVSIEAEIATSRESGEYKLDEVLREQIRRHGNDTNIDIARLVDAEVQDEAEFVTVLPDLADLLRAFQADANPPKLAILSDFYLPSNYLRTIASGAGLDLDGIDIFSSCELDQSKRQRGDLFHYVRHHFGVADDQHLHIGDNEYADGIQQTATGGLAALVRVDGHRFAAPGTLSKDSAGSLLDSLEESANQDACLAFDSMVGANLRKARVVSAGAQSAIFATSLVCAAIDAARAENVDSVHYLSREGAFLARVHRAVVASGAAGRHAPSAIALEVSRRSTFGASLRRLDYVGLNRMWSAYPNQSLSALFVSLGLQLKDYESSAQRYGLDPLRVIPQISSNEKVREFLSDAAVVKQASESLEARSSRLKKYLVRHADLRGGRAVMVDIGWRGTIQDNLAYVLPEVSSLGIYLGLFPFHNVQPPNVRKVAVAFDGNAGDLFNFADPPAAIERPWTADIPTAVDYDDVGDVVREVGESPLTADLINLYQDQVVASAPEIARKLYSFGVPVADMRDEIGGRLQNYYAHPHGGIADIWFGSEHDDTFGATNIGGYPKPRPAESWLGAGFNQKLDDSASLSRWPSGYRTWLPVEALHLVQGAIENGSWE